MTVNKAAHSKLKKLALSSQGLTAKQPFGTGLIGAQCAIEHLGYVQIDTLSVVERAHHHVLWNRVPEYEPAYLNQLVSKQQIFEYWYHAAAYLPMRDYRFALPQMNSVRTGESRYFKQGDPKLMREILGCIEGEGPMRLRDLDTSFKGNKVGSGAWWNMAPGKRAIEKLFMQGDLMVCARHGMEKVYDLTGRCLPDGIDLNMPSLYEYATYLFENTLRAHGVFTWKQLIHLKTGQPLRNAMKKVIDERLDAGEVRAVDAAHYVGVKQIEQLNSKAVLQVKILSPFDNVLIHRDRLSSLFGFDYRMECYVPAAKREFGYFCLPILYGHDFVGRIDCKAHRSEARLEVLSLHFEKNITDRKEFYAALSKSLQSLADFNQCPQLDKRVVDY